MQGLIIGLGHKSRQGKDSVARFIWEEFHNVYRIGIYSFADAMKREIHGRELDLCIKYGIPYDSDPDRTDPLCTSIHGKQPKLLQFYGEYKRSLDAFHWIHLLEAYIAKESPQVAIIPSVRHWNEAYWIKEKGGFVIDVVRPGFTDPSRDPRHITETALDTFPFDAVLSAKTGESEKLRRQALGLFADIVGAVEQSFSTFDFTEEALSRMKHRPQTLTDIAPDEVSAVVTRLKQGAEEFLVRRTNRDSTTSVR